MSKYQEFQTFSLNAKNSVYTSKSHYKLIAKQTGQLMWQIWHSGHFRDQGTWVQIQTWAFFKWHFWMCKPWSSLVEGDELLDRPNSQTSMELCRECVVYVFLRFNINRFGQYSIHLLLLKSSMCKLFRKDEKQAENGRYKNSKLNCTKVDANQGEYSIIAFTFTVESKLPGPTWALSWTKFEVWFKIFRQKLRCSKLNLCLKRLPPLPPAARNTNF